MSIWGEKGRRKENKTHRCSVGHTECAFLSNSISTYLGRHCMTRYTFATQAIVKVPPFFFLFLFYLSPPPPSQLELAYHVRT